jgi:hypothetical protein
MRLRQAAGDFWRECCQMRMTFHPCRRSWRVTRLSRAMLSARLLMLSPPASSTLRAAQQRSLSEPPLRFRVVPELQVGFRAGVALRTAVPETSVDEDGEFMFGKSKVGLSGQRQMPSPACDVCAAYKAKKHKLRGFVVPRPDKRHHLRPLLFRPNVRHRGK